MEELSSENRILLQRFADAPNHILHVDTLSGLYADAEREERIRALKALNMITVESTITKSLGNGVCVVGHPVSWRITAKGLDYLSAYQQQLDQQRQQNAELHAKERIQRTKALLDKKEKARHDFKVAAFTAALTLLVEHIPDVLNYLRRVLEMVGVLPK